MPQYNTHSLPTRVYVGASDLQKEPSSRTSSSQERDEPVPVQPVHMERHTEDGSRVALFDDEPQREQHHQAVPSPEGGNFVGVLSSSPPGGDRVRLESMSAMEVVVYFILLILP